MRTMQINETNCEGHIQIQGDESSKSGNIACDNVSTVKGYALVLRREANFKMIVVNGFSQTEYIASHYTTLILDTDVYSSSHPICKKDSNIDTHFLKG